MIICRVRVFDAGEYTPLLRRAARSAVKLERPDFPCLVDVSLVSDSKIRELNHERRGVDKVTDVLSFPMIKKSAETGNSLACSRLTLTDNFPDPDTGRVFLGDVIISPSMAKRQAAEYRHSLERELAYLTVHGVLHLLGYDHGTDWERAVMRKKEEEIMERMGLIR